MKNRPLCSLCLILFFIMCICIYAGRGKCVSALRPSPLERYVSEDEVILLDGEIYKKEIRDKYQVLYLKNNSIKYQKQFLNESKIIVYEEEKTEAHIGQRVMVKGEVSFFEPARNPGNFDQKLYYQIQDIHASVWAESVKITNDKTDFPADRLYIFRQKWKMVFDTYMPEEEGTVLSAMILGEKSGMDDEMKELYQVNGIGHILAKKCTNGYICV